MKKGEIFLVVILILFGVAYHAVEKGKARLAGDFSFYSDERKLKGSRFTEFPEPEKLFATVERVVIENPAGEVVVNRSDDGQVHLISLVRVYFSNQSDGEALRRKIGVKTTLNDGDLKISVDHPSPFPYSRLRILFRLLVPENAIVAVTNHEGNVIIQNTGKKIRIDQENGGVFLTDIRSSLELRLNHCDADLKNIADHIEIAASHSRIALENALSLRLVGKHGDCVLKKIEKEVSIEYAFGKVVLTGAGKTDISSRHCDIHATNVEGGIVVSNKYDAVFLENISGDVHVSNHSGPIEVRHASGGSVVIENAYGNTRILDFTGGNLDARIKNGAFELGATSVTDRINIESRYADVKLNLGVLPDPTLHVGAEHGRIVIDSPLDIETYEENEKRFANRAGQKPEILVHSVYGDIRLKSAM